MLLDISWKLLCITLTNIIWRIVVTFVAHSVTFSDYHDLIKVTDVHKGRAMIDKAIKLSNSIDVIAVDQQRQLLLYTNSAWNKRTVTVRLHQRLLHHLIRSYKHTSQSMCSYVLLQSSDNLQWFAEIIISYGHAFSERLWTPKGNLCIFFWCVCSLDAASPRRLATSRTWTRPTGPSPRSPAPAPETHPWTQIATRGRTTSRSSATAASPARLQGRRPGELQEEMEEDRLAQRRLRPAPRRRLRARLLRAPEQPAAQLLPLGKWGASWILHEQMWCFRN